MAEDVKQISTLHDAGATRSLRAKVLQSEELSKALAEAIASVFDKFKVDLPADAVVSFEPVVTKRVDPKLLDRTVPGSNMQSLSKDENAHVHVIETRSIVRSYAVTASAWLG